MNQKQFKFQHKANKRAQFILNQTSS